MGAYVAANWPLEAESHLAVAALREETRQLAGWRPLVSEPGFLVLTEVERPIGLHTLPGGRGVVLGELYRRRPFGAPAGRLAAGADQTLRSLCQQLSGEYWGRYVVLAPKRREGGMAVFRDPTGAVDAVCWRSGPIRWAASHAPAWLRARTDFPTEIDWSRVAQILADPAAAAGEVPLIGTRTPPPGVLMDLERQDQMIWTPADHLEAAPASVGAARDQLAGLAQACVETFARAPTRLLAEVSGGLDSAVVAAALVQSPRAKVVGWLNFHTEEPEGDERPYARAVAARLGFELTEIAKPAFALTPGRLAPAASGLRPSLLGVDAPYDEGLVEAARARRARRILTGQGGDTVFFQMPTARLAGDLLGFAGPRAIVSPQMAALSHWLKRSVWSMVREAALSSGAKGPPLRAPPGFLKRGVSTPYRHPWLEVAAGAPAAKLTQIAGLVHALIFHGPSQRAWAADVVHPLLAQPLVEAALATPAPWLVDGGRDRGLIRQAFADRLPRALIDRRSKGDLTAHYGRALAAGLIELRPFLLEGHVARAGLLDRKSLGARLEAEDLIWRGGYGELLVLAAVEAWLNGLATG